MPRCLRFLPCAVLAVFLVSCGTDVHPVDVDDGTDVQAGDVPDQPDADTMDVQEPRDIKAVGDVGPDSCLADCGDFGPGEDACGDCDSGEDCVDGACVNPNCAGKECGDDGFGNSCGECTGGQMCDHGECGFWDYPDCVLKECGDDGVGGSCGECGEGYECNAGHCTPLCSFPSDLPTTWGTAGVVDYLHVPTDTAEKAACYDYTGDGTGDSSLTYMASQTNPNFDGISNWKTAIILEFVDVVDYSSAISFTLNGLRGEPVTAGTLAGDMLVDQDSWNDGCVPYMRFNGAAIVEGSLSAHAGVVSVFINLTEQFALQIDFLDAHVTGGVQSGETGVSVADGVFSGVLTQVNYYKTMERLEAECSKDPQPEGMATICAAALQSPRIVGPDHALFDIYRAVDGSYMASDAEHAGNAAAVCMKFTAAPASITGYTSVAK